MRSIVPIESLLAAGHASAEACVEKDTNMSETAKTAAAEYLLDSVPPVSNEPYRATASLTLMLAVESTVGDVIRVKSKLDGGAFRKLAMRRVFLSDGK